MATKVWSYRGAYVLAAQTTGVRLCYLAAGDGWTWRSGYLPAGLYQSNRNARVVGQASGLDSRSGYVAAGLYQDIRSAYVYGTSPIWGPTVESGKDVRQARVEASDSTTRSAFVWAGTGSIVQAYVAAGLEQSTRLVWAVGADASTRSAYITCGVVQSTRYAFVKGPNRGSTRFCYLEGQAVTTRRGYVKSTWVGVSLRQCRVVGVASGEILRSCFVQGEALSGSDVRSGYVQAADADTRKVYLYGGKNPDIWESASGSMYRFYGST